MGFRLAAELVGLPESMIWPTMDSGSCLFISLIDVDCAALSEREVLQSFLFLQSIHRWPLPFSRIDCFCKARFWAMAALVSKRPMTPTFGARSVSVPSLRVSMSFLAVFSSLVHFGGAGSRSNAWVFEEEAP